MFTFDGGFQVLENIAKCHSFYKLANHFYLAVFRRWTYFRTFKIFILLIIVNLAFPYIAFGVLAFLEEDLAQFFFYALLAAETVLCGTAKDYFAILSNLSNQSVFIFRFNFIRLLFFSFHQIRFNFNQFFKYFEIYHFFLFHFTFITFEIKLISHLY